MSRFWMRSAKSSTCKIRSGQGGFSLLEIGIVLLIIATVVGGGLAVFTASLDKQKEEETRGKMRVIQKALQEYRNTRNCLPCPAGPGEPYGNTTYGQANCAATGIAYVDEPSTNLPRGMVPTRALGLADDMAIDGWGRRIMYAVNVEYTSCGDTNASFETIPVTGTSSTGFNVYSLDSNIVTGHAVYVLISYGANGGGAYSRKGAPLGFSGAGAEIANASSGTGIYQGITYSKDFSGAVFDDIVVYATRAQMYSPNE